MHRRHLLAAAGLAMPLQARAQANAAWPARQTLRIVVPFPPAGFSDFVSRVMTAPMGATLGQTVLIENRPGAGGTVGADHIAKSPADGYSFIVSHVSPHGTAPGVYPQLPYDPVGDFTHLAFVCETPTAIMVRRNSPIGSFEDFLARARGPGLRVGTSGIGSIGHLQSELMMRRGNATMLEHVPYRGTAPAVQDLLAGTIESIFEPVAGLIPQLTGTGPMRMLVLSGPARLKVLPEVPLLSERGFADVTATAWMGFSGPKGLPPEIARRMTEATVAAIARPEVRQRMEELAVFPAESPLTGAPYAAFIGEFGAKWTAVAKAANIVAG
jgi:tripartite-type tricarboxylate transporter receptor subunit TctC